MGVTYHLVPIESKTEEFIPTLKIDKNLNTDFTQFADLIINFRDIMSTFFEVDYSYFDLIFCLDEVETSIVNFEPQYLKNKFKYLEEKLKLKEPFPIEKFHYFAYEDMIDLTFLYVNLKGKYLNKIVKNKVYFNDTNYEISIKFDRVDIYELDYTGKMKQRDIWVRIQTENGEHSSSCPLNLETFPSELKINNTLSNIKLGKEIKTVNLIVKSPHEHFSNLFSNFNNLFDECIKRDLKLKAHVSC